MKEVENLFFVTGVLFIVYVLGVLVIAGFSDNDMTGSEFAGYIIIAGVGFCSLITSAYIRAERKGKDYEKE